MLKKTVFLASLFAPAIYSGSFVNHAFKESKPITKANVVTNSKSLLEVTQSTLLYFNAPHLKEDNNISSVLYKNKNLYLKNTKLSLLSLKSFLQEHPDGAVNLEQLNKHFRYIKWNGDTKNAAKHHVKVPEGQIRLTKYLVFEMKGSSKKTSKYCHALYSLPKDEDGLSEAQVEKRKSSLIRFRYTKQNIVSGILEKGRNAKLVEPLAWVTREGLEEALMQGTIVLEIPGRGKRIFNVHKNNDIPYKKTLKDKYKQKRYWYFKEPRGFNGYGKDFNSRVTVFPEVTFAGDVKHLGFGTIIALRYINPITLATEIRLGIIADTGAAFENNLYQLDYFTGAFKSRAEFKQQTRNIPDHVEAFILAKS